MATFTFFESVVMLFVDLVDKMSGETSEITYDQTFVNTSSNKCCSCQYKESHHKHDDVVMRVNALVDVI